MKTVVRYTYVFVNNDLITKDEGHKHCKTGLVIAKLVIYIRGQLKLRVRDSARYV